MNDSIGDIFKWIARHKYLAVTIAFLAIVILFDENNLLKHINNRREIAALNSAGPGSLLDNFVDTLYNITEEELAQTVRQ